MQNLRSIPFTVQKLKSNIKVLADTICQKKRRELQNNMPLIFRSVTHCSQKYRYLSHHPPEGYLSKLEITRSNKLPNLGCNRLGYYFYTQCFHGVHHNLQVGVDVNKLITIQFMHFSVFGRKNLKRSTFKYSRSPS